MAKHDFDSRGQGAHASGKLAALDAGEDEEQQVGRFTREEITDAFERYQARGAEAGRTGDWNAWADQFTEDAVYVEHLYGEFHGREAIRAWITETMGTPPGNQMPEFPIEWWLIDEDRDRVVCWVWNRMEDPGDGSIHQEGNITLLDYAGNDQWSREEDIYNPAKFGVMLEGWNTARAAAGGARPSS